MTGVVDHLSAGLFRTLIRRGRNAATDSVMQAPPPQRSDPSTIPCGMMSESAGWEPSGYLPVASTPSFPTRITARKVSLLFPRDILAVLMSVKSAGGGGRGRRYLAPQPAVLPGAGDRQRGLYPPCRRPAACGVQPRRCAGRNELGTSRGSPNVWSILPEIIDTRSFEL